MRHQFFKSALKYIQYISHRVKKIKKFQTNRYLCQIEFKHIVLEIITQFNFRFEYFDKMKSKLELFRNPMEVYALLQPSDF